jgi:hypothetical protein
MVLLRKLIIQWKIKYTKDIMVNGSFTRFLVKYKSRNN